MCVCVWYQVSQSPFFFCSSGQALVTAAAYVGQKHCALLSTCYPAILLLQRKQHNLLSSRGHRFSQKNKKIKNKKQFPFFFTLPPTRGDGAGESAWTCRPTPPNLSVNQNALGLAFQNSPLLERGQRLCNRAEFFKLVRSGHGEDLRVAKTTDDIT